VGRGSQLPLPGALERQHRHPTAPTFTLRARAAGEARIKELLEERAGPLPDAPASSPERGEWLRRSSICANVQAALANAAAACDKGVPVASSPHRGQTRISSPMLEPYRAWRTGSRGRLGPAWAR